MTESEKRPIDVDAILSELTLEEKVALCSGRDFWHLESMPRPGLPSVMVTDGPHGLRKQRGTYDGFTPSGNVPATCFPTAVTLASTWNRDLVREVGAAIAEEAFAALYARPLPPNRPERRGQYTRNTPLGDIRGSLAALLLRAVIWRQAKAAFADDPDNPMARHYETILEETPLRQMLLFTGGAIALDARPIGQPCARSPRLEGGPGG